MRLAWRAAASGGVAGSTVGVELVQPGTRYGFCPVIPTGVVRYLSSLDMSSWRLNSARAHGKVPTETTLRLHAPES